MNHSHETAQSVLSYGAAGATSVTALTLDSMAGVAESVTILLACAVVAVRLVYDVTRYIRYIHVEKEED